MDKRTDKNKKPRRRWVKIVLIIVLLGFVLTLGVGIYAISMYNDVKKTVNEKMHESVDSIDPNTTKKKVEASKPLNILLLGVDQRAHDKGRSDALMVLSLDPKRNSMQLVSIPRDTRTMIVGKGFKDKINHAYAFGGSEMSVATVENFLDIELDYYVRMNMDGLKSLVDELGTITVKNQVAWSDGKYKFTVGPVTMDGDKTMHFVRMRKQDPNGGFGRTKRQRQVIQAIIEKGVSIDSAGKIDSLVNILGNSMVTNMEFDDMKKLLMGYKDTRNNAVSYQMKGSGTNIDGTYYLMVPETEVEKVHNMVSG